MFIHVRAFVICDPLNDHFNKQSCSYGRLPGIKEQPKNADLSAFMSGSGCTVNTMNHSSVVWWFKYNYYTLKRSVIVRRRIGLFNTDFTPFFYCRVMTKCFEYISCV